MVDVDPIRRDAQRDQAVVLGSEILLVGGTACIADEKRRHGPPPEMRSARYDAAAPTTTEAATLSVTRDHRSEADASAEQDDLRGRRRGVEDLGHDRLDHVELGGGCIASWQRRRISPLLSCRHMLAQTPGFGASISFTMLLRQLEYLSALAREGHFGRAAQACHVSQPGLSAGIRKLEAELGVQIVQRGHRFEGFTPEGKRVLLWAHRMLAEQDALRDELSSMRVGLSGVLRIGAIPTALTVPSLLIAPLLQRHPLVRVSLESLSSREIVDRLSEFDVDVGMTYVDGEPLGTVRSMQLYRERYLLLTRSNGEFAGRDSVGWAEAATTPLCLLSPVMQNRRILDRNFAEAGVTVTPLVETDTVSAIYAHVGTMPVSSVIAHAWLHVCHERRRELVWEELLEAVLRRR